MRLYFALVVATLWLLPALPALADAVKPGQPAVNQQVLDAFDYADAAAVAKAWVPWGATGVAPVREDGRTAIDLPCPFAAEPNVPRVYIDRRVKLDLAAPGEFLLDMSVLDPAGVGQVSLYFRSGDGWFASGADLRKKGWQTLRFSKTSFRVEGSPTGWHAVDGIRIAIWRGGARNGSVRIGRLVAQWHDVALVMPAAADRHGNGEHRAAMETADRVGTMLDEMGLGSDAIDDASLAHGALAGRHVAILAYNPVLPDEAAAALERFVLSGGKLLVCYQLPPRLQTLLGFGRPKYVRPEPPDQFAEIRFDAPDVPGLPPSVHQASWNITAAEPIGHRARVIGQWYDPQGKPTGQPAMLLGEHGAFFSHLILGDDRPGKKQMLAAVLGELYPPLWRQMVDAECGRRDHVGHLGTTEEVITFVITSSDPTAKQRLDSSIARLDEYPHGLYKEVDCPKAIQVVRESRDLLAEAYLRATPSRSPEGRAFWNHSGTGAYPGDWDRTAKSLAAAHFNMIFPNMLWAGVAHYPSDLLPRSATFRQHGDQVAQCVAAAHRNALEVHVWKVNYNLSGAPPALVERLRREGRTQVSAAGKPLDWLCPSHSENFTLELESMLEVARKYEVDGLQFDYIRYPDADHCYCDGCRARFEAASGRPVARWPQDCYSGSRREEYRDWRCRQITRLVEAVHREAKKIRPAIKISAAVFGSYPACRDSVGQDWVAWVNAGFLDFVCPMDYTESDLAFSTLVARQIELVGGRVPIYPGIGASATRSTLPPDRVVGQIHHARALGAAGFTIFNLDRGAIETIVPGVGLGATSQPAVPPHRGQ